MSKENIIIIIFIVAIIALGVFLGFVYSYIGHKIRMKRIKKSFQKQIEEIFKKYGK